MICREQLLCGATWRKKEDFTLDSELWKVEIKAYYVTTVGTSKKKMIPKFIIDS